MVSSSSICFRIKQLMDRWSTDYNSKFNEVKRIFNKIASNYSVDPAKFDFLLPRLVQIEKMSEYGTEFIITPIVSNTYQSIFIPEKPDEQFNVNKVLILYTLLFKC